MERAVDILFITGVLINFIKGADLILRPHQQKWLQKKFESITLWLEYFKPLAWLSKLTTARGQIILLMTGSIEFVGVAVVVLLTQNNERVSTRDRFIQLIVIGLGVLSLPIIVRRVGPKLTKWLWGDGRFDKFALRFLLLIFGGYIFLFFYMFVVGLVIWLFSSHKNYFDLMEATMASSGWENVAYSASLLIIWPLFTLFWVILQVSGLVLWAIVLLFLFEIVLKFFRGFAWRVV
jgi:hypothetical protein